MSTKNMKQIHIFLLIMVCAMSSIMTSCQKTNHVVKSVNTTTNDIGISAVRDDNSPDNDTIIKNTLHALNSYSSSAGLWWIKSSYESNYTHFCQLNASPEYPGGVLCGPTAYMLGVHMLSSTYPSSKTRIGTIYNRLSVNGKFDNSAGMYISDIQWYRNSYDATIVNTAYKRTSNRSTMKEFIESNLKNGFPVIATVQVYGSNRQHHINDNLQYACTTNYIGENGNIGHFILLIGIEINSDGTGKVWYKDPLSPNGWTQSVTYTRLLDAMKYNGNTNYYDAIALSKW